MNSHTPSEPIPIHCLQYGRKLDLIREYLGQFMYLFWAQFWG